MMKRLTIDSRGVAAGLSVLCGLAGAWGVASAQVAAMAPPSSPETRMQAEVRYPQDPADSVYRAAREALDRQEYGRAAGLFRTLRERHAGSAYAPDSYYWEAFALYRSGGGEELRMALDVLERQRARHPGAATRGDAETLSTRIRGALAQLGDAEAAEWMAREAERIAPAAPPSGRTPSGPPAPPQEGACPDEDQDQRIAVLNALLNMDPERAFPILQRVMERRDECSATLRRKAVFLLSQKVTPQTEDVLLRAVSSDPDPEVRSQAVFWLSQVPTARAVGALEEILRSSDDREVQKKAIFALSQHRSEQAGQILRDFAVRTDAPEELREQAIFWIGQHGSQESAAFLRDLYTRLDRSGLREKVIFSLAQMRGRENASWLLERAADASEPMELRKHAVFWAAQSGGALDDLVALYDRVGDRELKEKIIFSLTQAKEASAVDKLMEIARSDPDPELRKKAIFWLGQSDDPRVMEFLLELIDQ